MYEGKNAIQETGALLRTKFSISIEPVQKALSRLEEAVEHVYNQFAPILGPDRPADCGCDNEKDAPQCDYERFISLTSAKIYAACERLDLVCDRSVI